MALTVNAEVPSGTRSAVTSAWPEISIPRADRVGANARTVTDIGCASFAPMFTPDGKKILFSSNKHACDSRKFELYRMNLDGSDLEQVTGFGGFTSFPEFSPYGKTLVFCSDRGPRNRTSSIFFYGEVGSIRFSARMAFTTPLHQGASAATTTNRIWRFSLMRIRRCPSSYGPRAPKCHRY